MASRVIGEVNVTAPMACSLADWQLAGEGIFFFGKHHGRRFSEVRLSDPGYCAWALRIKQPFGAMADFVEYLRRGAQFGVGATGAQLGVGAMGTHSIRHSLHLGSCSQVAPWLQGVQLRAQAMGVPSIQDLPLPRSCSRVDPQFELGVQPSAGAPGAHSTHDVPFFGLSSQVVPHLPGVPLDFGAAVGDSTRQLQLSGACLQMGQTKFQALGAQHQATCVTRPIFQPHARCLLDSSLLQASRCSSQEASKGQATPRDKSTDSFVGVASRASSVADQQVQPNRAESLTFSFGDYDSHALEKENASQNPRPLQRLRRTSMCSSGTENVDWATAQPTCLDMTRHVESASSVADQQVQPSRAVSFSSSIGDYDSHALEKENASQNPRPLKRLRRTSMCSSGTENVDWAAAQPTCLGMTCHAESAPCVADQQLQQSRTMSLDSFSGDCDSHALEKENASQNLHPLKQLRRTSMCSSGTDDVANQQSCGPEQAMRETARGSKQRQAPESTDSPKEKWKSGVKHGLGDISCAAEAAAVHNLVGPSDALAKGLSLEQRRAEVRQSIRRGCMNFRSDFWATADTLHDSSSCLAYLKEHQVVGVRWLLALHRCVPGMILADEMGLGKTVQVLCFLEILASTRPSLIIAPASLMDTWIAEAAKWTPNLRTFRYHAKSASNRAQLQKAYFDHTSDHDLIITTPQAAHNKEDKSQFFRRISFEVVVVDEAHGLKNAKTARYKDLLQLACRTRLLLTGTPVQNSLTELVSLFEFALSGAESRKEMSTAFQSMLDEPIDRALPKLQALAGPLILRRLKADVLAALPAKRGVVIHCKLLGRQQELYDGEMQKCRERVQQNGVTVRDAFLNLRRICLHPLLGKWAFKDEELKKMCQQLVPKRPDMQRVSLERVIQEVGGWSDFEKHRAAVEYRLGSEFQPSIENLMGSTKMMQLLRILQQQTSNACKTLVFSQFTQLLDITEAVLTQSSIKYCRLDGSTPIEERQELASAFQDDGGPLAFLVSTKAGGVGLTLTAANAVVMLDLDFNPQNTRQAEDRVHRLGQRQDVTVYYLVCQGTVEEMVLKRNISKMQLDQQFGGEHATLELAAAGSSRDAGKKVDVLGQGGQRDGTIGNEDVDDGKSCEDLVLQELSNKLCNQQVSGLDQSS